MKVKDISRDTLLQHLKVRVPFTVERLAGDKQAECYWFVSLHSTGQGLFVSTIPPDQKERVLTILYPEDRKEIFEWDVVQIEFTEVSAASVIKFYGGSVNSDNHIEFNGHIDDHLAWNAINYLCKNHGYNYLYPENIQRKS